MKFEKDLLIQKSTTKAILGALDILVITLWILIKISIKEPFEIFDWTYLLILLSLGVLFILEGLGVPFAKIFGKAFILIDHEQISLKKSVLSKEQTILWSDIKTIEYRPNVFHFTKIDGTKEIVKLRSLAFQFNREILDFVKVIGKHKGLIITRLNEFKNKPKTVQATENINTEPQECNS